MNEHLTDIPLDQDMSVFHAHYRLFKKRFKSFVSDYKMIAHNEVFSEHVKNSCNQKYITRVIDDYLIFDGGTRVLTTVNDILRKNNNTLCIITDVFGTTVQSKDIIKNLSNIKIIFVPELFGLYDYDYDIQPITGFKKTFCALNQRVQIDRFYFLKALIKKDLFNSKIGNISFLFKVLHHDEIDKVIEDTQTILNDEPVLKALIGNPTQTFNDTGNMFDIESECLISVVYETYNHEVKYGTSDFALLTEKTIRSLMVPNISLFINEVNAVRALENFGFKFHPINYLLDGIEDFVEQANVVTDIISHPEMLDINYKTMYNNAIHNRDIIKSLRRTISTDKFYTQLSEKINN